MTVEQLREALSRMPGHIPVHIAMPVDDGSGESADTQYLFTLDCTVEAFPSQGRMAVISINREPK